MNLARQIDQMNSAGGGTGVKWNHLLDILKLCIHCYTHLLTTEFCIIVIISKRFRVA